MSIFDVAIDALDGGPANLGQYRGKAVLVVNVASKCGLTPQYASLQRLYEMFQRRGLVVLGVPCNQFGAQEPGTAAQIRDFCEANFGITFPITQKVDVNGPDRHELFAQLVQTPDADGVAGDVRWNFEKFLVCPDGTVAARFRPLTDPLAPELVAAVQQHLPIAEADAPAEETVASAADAAGWPQVTWPPLPVPTPEATAAPQAPAATPQPTVTQPTVTQPAVTQPTVTQPAPEPQIVQPARTGSRWRRVWSR